ncbi:MAG: serine hydrolase [Flavobacteriia bacterium]|nr:serine hydrolase [Flavobacteriia bacterium]
MKYWSILAVLLFISCEKEPPPSPPEPSEPSIYFPANWSGDWETLDPEVLDWNTGAIQPLLDFLDSNGTRAFLVLVNGRMVIEHYSNQGMNGQPFERSSNWYWASAGKTLTAYTCGIAMQDGSLDLDHPSSDYLGTGWTSASSSQEMNITVRNQLTMTTGLDDGISNSDCTQPSCLEYLAVAGNRWAYHNAPYTLLHDVIGGATGATFDSYFRDTLALKIGMTGTWYWLIDNHVFFSNARSMARFGILNLNKGNWNGEQILTEENHDLFTHSSQPINPSYGYLYWLNGQGSYMLPGSQIKFQGNLVPSAPSDMYAAMGKDSQLLMVVPSKNLIVVRMGEDPDQSLVPTSFPEELWQRLNQVITE